MARGTVMEPTGLIEVTPSALSALCLRCQPALPKINCHAMWQDREMLKERVGAARPPERKQMFRSRNASWLWKPSQRRLQRRGGKLKAWSAVVCSVSRGRSGWGRRSKTWSFSAAKRLFNSIFSTCFIWPWTC